MARVLVAVDVGGSGLRAVAQRDGTPGPVLHSAGARISADGLNLAELVRAARAVIADDERPDVVVFGARGIISLAQPSDAIAELAGFRARRTAVCTDAVTSLIGAIGEVRPGAVVAAGTGAIALGCDFAGRFRRVDGWGHVLGDRGSAAWIALRALQRLLARYDLCGPDDASLLWRAAVDQFGPPLRWPAQVMTRADAPELLAAFAPTVTECADSDPLAGQICRQAGEQLAKALLAAADGMPDPHLSATGGVFDAAVVREHFTVAIAAAGRQVQPPAGDGLSGGLRLAEYLQNRDVPSDPNHLIVSDRSADPTAMPDR